MAYQAASVWHETKVEQSLAHTYPDLNYLPAPLEEVGNTGIRGLLPESLVTSCGSGSWCEEAFSLLRERVVEDNFSGGWTVLIFAPEEVAEQALPPTIVEKLEEIRSSFGVSIASLAEILGASRASVYNWLENETPTERFIQHIDALYEVAHEWKEKNPYHYPPGRLMKQKLADGPSMHERLSREEPDVNEIHNGMDNLLALMGKQREMMDRAKARSAKAASDPESHKELLERLTGSVTADK